MPYPSNTKGLVGQTPLSVGADTYGEISEPSNPPLTAERLRELLDYDPETGVFRWRKSLSWRAPVGAVAGSTTTNGRIAIRIAGHTYYGHALAFLHMTGEWPDGDVLARNGDRTDLRWENLKIATRSQTAMTRATPSNNTSGVKGVCWDRDRFEWKAHIGVNDTQLVLGYFDRFADAVAARKAAEDKYFGEFAGRKSWRRARRTTT